MRHLVQARYARGMERPQVVAHRGSSAIKAEHTLGAYVAALDEGADGLECDVRLTADGHLVCVHDRDLRRTATTEGVVSTMSLAQLEDLDFAEVHDCFTIAELLMYEAMGLTERGQGARALEEGWVFNDGKLPINVSGGLKAKGHPVGATGVSQHVIAAMQLTGTAGALQLPKADLGGVFNIGGAAVANYVSVLERVG